MVLLVFAVTMLWVFVYLFMRWNEWYFMRRMKRTSEREKILWWFYPAITFWFGLFLLLMLSFGMNGLNIGYFLLFLIKLMQRQPITIFNVIFGDRWLCSDHRMASFLFVFNNYQIIMFGRFYSIFWYDRKLFR